MAVNVRSKAVGVLAEVVVRVSVGVFVVVAVVSLQWANS